MGMRKGEVLRLKPEHINFGRMPVTYVVKKETYAIRPGWLLIEKSKNGKVRMIPMSRRVRRVLGFTSSCKEAKIDNFTFHDPRHTWATRAVEMGTRTYIRRAILGHSSTSMTDDHTHATPEAMEEAMEMVASYGVHYGRITARRLRRQGQAIQPFPVSC
jgi:integrase